MLTALPQSSLSLSFGQSLIVDERKVTTVCYGNIEEESYARDRNNTYQLVLYTRSNTAGRQEAGIIYGMLNKRGGDFLFFPEEMLRLFSKDPRDCYDLAKKYYIDLVDENKLRCSKKID